MGNSFIIEGICSGIYGRNGSQAFSDVKDNLESSVLQGRHGILRIAQLLETGVREDGQEGRPVSPQYVKPFVCANRNDAEDGLATCEASL
ncbi:MAG: hypothetical protein VST70_01345 [Nitrospirota bacterium]|nr:hypothetical protein [Nitrospirota bacterium]